MTSSGRLPPRDIALALAVVFLWGFNFVPIRWTLDEVPPLALVALRFLLAAVPMVFFVRRPAAPAWLVIAYGLAIGVGQFGLLYLGIARGMPAGLASLVIQAQVFLTIGLAAAFLGDRVRPQQFAGTVLAALGIVLLAGARVATGAASTLEGFALCIAAALSWAVGNVLVKRMARNAKGEPPDMFALVVWSSLAAPLPLAALSYLTEGGLAPLHAIAVMSLRAWACVLFMSFGATLFGFAVWNRLLHKHPTASIAPFALLVPLAGVLSAWLLLGETLSWLQAVAGALVLAGLALNVISLPASRAVAPRGAGSQGRGDAETEKDS